MNPEPDAPAGGWLRWWPVLGLAAVVMIGFLVRALATLGPDCIAGEDGAYYFVQVRGILRGRGLPVPDFPLLFYVMAGVSWLLSAFMDLPIAIVVAVRWVDTLLPLLLAVPVYFFARDFAPERSARATLAVVLAGLLAVASGNMLQMAGGMIKNSAAMPFCLLYLYYVDRSLRVRAARPILLAGLWFLVAALTHISALALNAVITVLLVLTGLSRRRGGWTLGMLAGLGLVLALVLALDPDRGTRLLEVLVRPVTAFGGTLASLEQPAVWLGNGLGLLGLGLLWRRWGDMDPETRSLIGAASLAALACSCPFLRPDLLERLALVAFVVGLVPAVYLVCRYDAGSLLVAPLVFFSLLHGFLAVKTLRVTGLVRPALEDLEQLRKAVPAGRNLVMVRHGLEWWAVWGLDTCFSNWAERALGEREAFDAILLLEEVRPGAFGQAPTRAASWPGATLRDGALLGGKRFTILGEGTYFRLSRLDARKADSPEGSSEKPTAPVPSPASRAPS